jgi:alkaline phosphatase D
MPRRSLLLFLVGIFTATGIPAAEPLQHIAFGSCLNKTEHLLLDRALTLPMDLFVFLGDNIYADTTNMTVMRGRYDALKSSTFFRGLRNKAPILATWDDHDYGWNDAGANYAMRRESQKEFYDWLDEPANSPRRRQEGVYDARVFGPPGKRVQVILLDTRYFRSPLKRGEHNAEPSGGPYVPDEDPAKTMLGETQWKWLEGELRKPAELRLIASSIQFVAEFAGCEAWVNFPREKQRFLDLIQRTRANGVFFVSGDRHWSEFSKLPGPLGYSLWDFTSSGMTQRHPRGTPTPNKHRALPTTFHEANVGHLSLDWSQLDPQLTVRIVDAEGQTRLEQVLKLSELQPKAR